MSRREDLTALSDAELQLERDHAAQAGDLEWAERCDSLLRQRAARRHDKRHEEEVA